MEDPAAGKFQPMDRSNVPFSKSRLMPHHALVARTDQTNIERNRSVQRQHTTIRPRHQTQWKRFT
jgi:hypothetical protein